MTSPQGVSSKSVATCASFTPKAMGAYQFVAKADRWDANLIRRFRYWLASTIAREHPAFKAEEASRD